MSAVAAAAAVLASAALLVHVLGRLGQGGVSLWTAALTVGATPVLWYTFQEPRSGHVLLFAAGTGALVLLSRPGSRSRRGDVFTGLGLGLTLAAVEQGVELALGGASTLAFRPQRLFAVEALFSSRQGFFFWTPVAWVGVAGLFLLGRRRPGTARRLAAAVLAVAAVSALSSPWWSGRFGNGRLVAALPLLAPGLGAVLEWLQALARRAPLHVLASAGAAVVAWNLLFMEQYRQETIPRDDTVAFPAVAHNSARLVSAAVGSPLAWPANWALAAGTGIGPERFDRLVGVTLFTLPGSLRGVVDIGRMETDEALLGPGWSVRHPCEDEICRDLEGPGTVFLPFDERAEPEVALRARGTGPVEVVLDGSGARRVELTPHLQTHLVRLGAAPLACGLHVLTLRAAPGAVVSVDRLAFRRAR